MEASVVSRKKLIETALPLDAINAASAREKSIRHGHPSTLHLWWARRPLAAARAVIFAQMVDDPSTYLSELKGNQKSMTVAKRTLEKRHKAWEEAAKLAQKAKEAGTTAPEPGAEPTLEEVLIEKERERLFEIIRDMVLWENTSNEEVMERARQEIRRSWYRACADNADHPQAKELFNREKLPAFHDPFAGGGALPLEAQRLGLESYASDLNPVAVLINKAMIEIPPKFAGHRPVGPPVPTGKGKKLIEDWSGAKGLAEDVRRYGHWMREEAEKRIGHLYPKVKVTEKMAEARPDLEAYVGEELTVIAWLWARTVHSPNPAFRDVEVPLASSFILSKKKGKEAWVEPVIEGKNYRFVVHAAPLNQKDESREDWEKKQKAMLDSMKEAKDGTSAGKRKAFKCLISGTPLTYDYIRDEGKTVGLGARLMAIVAEGKNGRVYLDPIIEQERIAKGTNPKWKPEMNLPNNPRDFKTPNYGLNVYGDLFTNRQLFGLNTFSDLIGEVIARVKQDAQAAGMKDDGQSLDEGGIGATSYGEAIGVYLSFLISQVANHSSTVCGWNNTNTQMRSVFARQAIPMTWDFAESNIFSSSSGSFLNLYTRSIKAFNALVAKNVGWAKQGDAHEQALSLNKVVSTDPPYYDNIGYADLSDFFYVWLRRSLRHVFSHLFSTMAVPKATELIATPYRHGGQAAAEEFFLSGMTSAIKRVSDQHLPIFPVTIYYAFKQSEIRGEIGAASTGWETFLEAILEARFALTGTWPVRTEKIGRVIGNNTNALASSIVLVCRRRPDDAPTVTRRDFVGALKAELPVALRDLQAGNIAPVDMAQAAIGPGMAVFTRYERVVDAEGQSLGVREALALINEVLDETLAEREGDFDADSRWALAWFEQNGFEEGEYGVAETLSKAKNTSVSGLVEAGILESSGGRVRLLRPEELSASWNPATDTRLTHWECVHHLIRRLNEGETAAAETLAKLGSRAEATRQMAYRLYNLCERKRWASEALAYNGLVQSWPDLAQLATTMPQVLVQGDLL